MKTLIAGLKWAAKFLENRFPEKVDLSSLVKKADLEAHVAESNKAIATLRMDIAALQSEHEAQKKQNEIISLRVGLSRPMQTVLRSVK